MVGLLEDIRQSYTDVDEQRRLEELQRPRELKTHEPGLPLELPGPINVGGTSEGGAAPEGPRGRSGERASPGERSPPPPGGLNVNPPARNVEKQER
jgi:hypothetical protein